MNMIGLISIASLRTGARRADGQTDDLIHVCSLNYRQAGQRRLPAKGRTGARTTGRLRRSFALGSCVSPRTEVHPIHTAHTGFVLAGFLFADARGQARLSLAVEPSVFHAPLVVRTVDPDRDSLDLRI